MVNNNQNVLAGIANGTRAVIDQVHLHPGAEFQWINLGYARVRTIRAANVQKVCLRLEDSKTPQFIEVKPTEHSFDAAIPLPKDLQSRSTTNLQHLRMKGTQLPIICNNATTGHKLQGATIEDLFVHSWTSVQNWIYVVLSRVKTLSGLYLRLPLSHKDLDKYKEIPLELQEMLSFFEQEKMKQPFSTDDYDAILL